MFSYDLFSYDPKTDSLVVPHGVEGRIEGLGNVSTTLSLTEVCQ
jgi:hypothetical protein